jgi:predicted aspartyl protease
VVRDICTVQNSNYANYIDVCVGCHGNRRAVPGLIDTGATASLISAELCEKTRLKIEPQESKITLLSVEGSKLQVLGQTQASVIIDGARVNMMFLVTKNINHDMLIGCDNLVRHGAVVDVERGKVSWRNLGVASALRQRCPGGAWVKTVRAVTIPPRQTVRVEVRIPPWFPNGADAIIEACDRPRMRGELYIPNFCVVPSRARAFCYIVNSGDQSRLVGRNAVIGAISPAVDYEEEEEECEQEHEEEEEEEQEQEEEESEEEEIVSVSVAEVPSPDASTPVKKPEILQKDVSDFGSFDEKLTYLKRMGFKLEQQAMSVLQYENLVDILVKYSDCFLARTTPVHMPDYEIRFKEGMTPKSPPTYKHSPIVRGVIEDQLDQWLAQGVIEHGSIINRYPLVVVKKPCRCSIKYRSKGRIRQEFVLDTCPHQAFPTYRVVYDARRFNEAVETVNYQMPCIADICNDLEGMQFFSKLDVSQAFVSVPLHERSRRHLGLQVDNMSLRFCRLPYGLKLGSQIYQQCHDTWLKGLLHKMANVYIDDILLHARTIPEMLCNLVTVLKRYRRYNVRLSAEKCAFVKSEVPFLGVLLTSHGVLADPLKATIIRRLPEPNSQASLRSALALMSFYRKFIRGFGQRTHVFRPLLARNAEFLWTQKHSLAFRDLCSALASEDCLLKFPNYNKPFVLIVDSSAKAVGYSWLQEDEETKQLKAISHGSRLWKPAELNMAASLFELMGLVVALESNPCFCNGRVIVYTDSISNTFTQKLKDRSGPLFRWALRLAKYDLDIRHMKGRACPVDYLSRVAPEEGQPALSPYDAAIDIDLGMDERVVAASELTAGTKTAWRAVQKSANDETKSVRNVVATRGRKFRPRKMHSGFIVRNSGMVAADARPIKTNLNESGRERCLLQTHGVLPIQSVECKATAKNRVGPDATELATNLVNDKTEPGIPVMSTSKPFYDDGTGTCNSELTEPTIDRKPLSVTWYGRNVQAWDESGEPLLKVPVHMHKPASMSDEVINESAQLACELLPSCNALNGAGKPIGLPCGECRCPHRPRSPEASKHHKSAMEPSGDVSETPTGGFECGSANKTDRTVNGSIPLLTNVNRLTSVNAYGCGTVVDTFSQTQQQQPPDSSDRIVSACIISHSTHAKLHPDFCAAFMYENVVFQTISQAVEYFNALRRRKADASSWLANSEANIEQVTVRPMDRSHIRALLVQLYIAQMKQNTSVRWELFTTRQRMLILLSRNKFFGIGSSLKSDALRYTTWHGLNVIGSSLKAVNEYFVRFGYKQLPLLTCGSPDVFDCCAADEEAAAVMPSDASSAHPSSAQRAKGKQLQNAITTRSQIVNGCADLLTDGQGIKPSVKAASPSNKTGAPSAASHSGQVEVDGTRPMSHENYRTGIMLDALESRISTWLQRQTTSNWRKMQLECSDAGPMVRYLEGQELPVGGEQARRIVLEAIHFQMGENGLLYHMRRGRVGVDGATMQLVVPKAMQADLLEKLHENLFHASSLKMYLRLQEVLFFHGMYTAVINTEQKCHFCLRVRSRPPPRMGLLHAPVQYFHQRVYIDALYLGKAQMADGREVANVIVVTERLGGMIMAEPVTDLTADSHLDVLKRWVSVFGIPEHIHSDAGSGFQNRKWLQYCEDHGITVHYASGGRHESVGYVEVMNRRIVRCVRRLQDVKTWPQHLSEIIHTLNIEPSTVTGLTAHEITFGVEPKLLGDVIIPQGDVSDKLDSLQRRDRMDAVRLQASEGIEKSMQKMDRSYAKQVKRHEDPDYEVGQHVWVFDSQIPANAIRKFNRYYRPAVVIATCPFRSYDVKMSDSNHTIRVHVNRLVGDPDAAAHPAMPAEVKPRRRKQVSFQLPPNSLGEAPRKRVRFNLPPEDRRIKSIVDSRRRLDGGQEFKVIEARNGIDQQLWLAKDMIPKQFLLAYEAENRSNRRSRRGTDSVSQ